MQLSMSHSRIYETGMRLQSPFGTTTTLLQSFTTVNINPSGSNIYLAADAFYGENLEVDWKLDL